MSDHGDGPASQRHSTTLSVAHCSTLTGVGHPSRRATSVRALLGEQFKENGTVLEYSNVSNPLMSAMPVQSFPGSLHESGRTQTIPLDLSEHMGKGRYYTMCALIS